MKVLIIEDESVAAQQLRRQMAEVDDDIEVVDVLQSIEDSVEWFQSDNQVDLVFMDIHLADGSAFRIFDHVEVKFPIIFTTAYDQYALQAFKVNSIDYLLKPINIDELRRALDKYKSLTQPAQSSANADIEALMAMMRQHYHQYQSYFLIPQGDRLQPLAVADIAYIYLDNKVAQAVTLDGHIHAIDKPLDNIMEQLDPALFYRVNRQMVVAHKAISSISFWLLGKLKLNLVVDTPENVIVPKAKAAEFKQWYSK